MKTEDSSLTVPKVSSAFGRSLEMKAEEIADSICNAFKDCGIGFEMLREAQAKYVKALEDLLREALLGCAMFMATQYEVGITDPLVFIRTAPIKRIFVRWKIRQNVRKCCTQCSHYQKDCPIKNILLKGRW